MKPSSLEHSQKCFYPLNMDVVFELIGLVESTKIKLFLLLAAGCIILYCFLQGKKKLSVYHNTCLFLAAISALILVFSKVFSTTNKYYGSIYSKPLMTMYYIVCGVSLSGFLLLIAVPKLFLRISAKQKPITRWKMLKIFPLSILTENQRNNFLIHITYTLTLLGANAKADEYAKQIKNFKKTEFYHLLKTQKAYLQGNIEQEIQFSDSAVLSINRKTKPLYKHQFYINKAVGYFIRHDYKNADTYYKEAYKFIKNKKIRDMKLIFGFYKDFLINKVCLNADKNEIQKYLEEFRKYVKENNAEHWMLYFDLQLAVLQQTRASKKDFEVNIEDSLKKIEELKLKEEVRTIYIIKVARIITSCSSNPEHCIRLLTNRSKYLSKISFPEKYTVYKDLDYLFSNLRGAILICVTDLMEKTKRYFSEDAENEINSYLEKIPLEAVYERIYFIKELAWLRRIGHKEYEFQKVKQYLQSAINLCEENQLLNDAMLLRLNIADESLTSFNLDSYCHPKCIGDIKENADKVAKYAVKMQKSPLEAEFDFRLSYYYLRIHDYKNHINFYERFLRSNCPKDFFSAWCKIYIDICEFTYTNLKILNALETVSKSKQISAFNPMTQQFLKKYNSSNGEILSLIFGMFCGSDFVLKKCTLTNDSSTTEHWWLLNTKVGLEIDPLYKNFTNDENTERIFFIPKYHPLQTKESITAKTSSSVKMYELPSESLMFDAAFLLMYTEIADAINKELKRNE